MAVIFMTLIQQTTSKYALAPHTDFIKQKGAALLQFPALKLNTRVKLLIVGGFMCTELR